MIETAGLEHCLSFINCQLRDGGKSGASAPGGVRRAVTISRQAGCGALVVAEKLAHYLQEHSPKDECPWTVFDRNLMDKVLEDHNLPVRLARFLIRNHSVTEANGVPHLVKKTVAGERGVTSFGRPAPM